MIHHYSLMAIWIFISLNSFQYVKIRSQKLQETCIQGEKTKRFTIQTHCSSGSMELFTFTLVFQFFDFEPVCRSQSLSACFSVPQNPHLQTTLNGKKNPKKKKKKKKYA